jgi:hypothetical protein
LIFANNPAEHLQRLTTISTQQRTAQQPSNRFFVKMSATTQKKTFGKSTREVPHHSQKAKKWYPAEDEAVPKKVCYIYFLRLCGCHVAIAGCITVQSNSGVCEPDCFQLWSNSCISFNTPRATTNSAFRSEKPFVPLLLDQLSLPVLSSSSSLVASVASASSS